MASPSCKMGTKQYEQETSKGGIVVCPNDVDNKEKVRKIIASNPKETEEALSDLRERDIEFTE